MIPKSSLSISESDLREVSVAVFGAFHHYLGVGVGEPEALPSYSGRGHVRQHGVTPQRHPDHQLAATSSLLTSSTASPSITSSLALASDSALM